MSAPRRPLVVGNWKMNLDFVEAVHLSQQIGVLLKNRPTEHTDVVVMPPFVDLRSVASVVTSERIAVKVGAQHVSAHDNGAYTGEVSMSMLQRLGVEWILVGHSERRSLFAMDDVAVAATLRAVVQRGVNAVLCVGEDLAVRENQGETEFIRGQLESALRSLDTKFHENVVVAYEPLWAIGSGLTASAAQIATMVASIRTMMMALAPASTRVLYGGSVNAENATELMSSGAIDGFLVGGASLKSDAFLAIIQACDECYAGKR